MYSVSEAYLKAISSNITQDSISGRLVLPDNTAIAFDDDDIQSGSLKIDNQCVNGEELEFGSVYAGQLTFSLKSQLSRYRLYDARIELTYRIKVEGGTYFDVPLGVYWITEAVRDVQYIKITALDVMIKFEETYDGVSVLGTPFELLSYFCNKAGLELANTEAEIKALPNGNATIQIDATCRVDTWRDCVVMVTQFMACFSTASRDGKLCVKRFSTTPCITIRQDQRHKTEISDYKSEYKGVKITSAAGRVYESYGDVGSLVMEITDNDLFNVGLDGTLFGYADAIRQELCGISFTPSTIKTVSNPALECGDMIVIETPDDDVVKTVVTSYVWCFRDAHTLKGVGKNPYFSNVKSKSDKQISHVQTGDSTGGVAFEYFTNARKLNLGSSFTQVLSMVIASTKNTNAFFWAQALLKVSPDAETKTINVTDSKGVANTFTYTSKSECSITAAYVINNVELETFYPIEQFDEGNHILTLLYPLPSLEPNIMTRLAVKLKAENGTAIINIEQLKAGIIGQGMAGSGGEWDGTLTLTDVTTKIGIKPQYVSINNLRDGAGAGITPPVEQGSVQEIGLYGINPQNITIRGLVERLTFKNVITSYTLSLSPVEYDDTYVESTNEGLKLRTHWEYEGTDEGLGDENLTVVHCTTDFLETVNEIEVSIDGRL